MRTVSLWVWLLAVGCGGTSGSDSDGDDEPPIFEIPGTERRDALRCGDDPLPPELRSVGTGQRVVLGPCGHVVFGDGNEAFTNLPERATLLAPDLSVVGDRGETDGSVGFTPDGAELVVHSSSTLVLESLYGGGTRTLAADRHWFVPAFGQRLLRCVDEGDSVGLAWEDAEPAMHIELEECYQLEIEEGPYAQFRIDDHYESIDLRTGARVVLPIPFTRGTIATMPTWTTTAYARRQPSPDGSIAVVELGDEVTTGDVVESRPREVKVIDAATGDEITSWAGVARSWQRVGRYFVFEVGPAHARTGPSPSATEVRWFGPDHEVHTAPATDVARYFVRRPLVLIATDHGTALLDLRTGDARPVSDPTPSGRPDAVTSKSETFLAFARDNEVVVLDVASGATETVRGNDAHWVGDDGSVLVSAMSGDSAQFLLMNPAGAMLAEIPASADPYPYVHQAEEVGRRLVLSNREPGGDAPSTLRVIDLDSGEIRELESNRGVFRFQIDPHGQRIAFIGSNAATGATLPAVFAGAL